VESWLSLAELWYNSNYHSALGCSPFKALYGYEAELGTMLPVTTDSSSPASEFLQQRETQLAALKTHLAAAQNRMKLQADRSRSDRHFQVGERVLLKLQPYVQQSVVSRPYPKLAYKFFGPFTITEKIGAAAYRLNLPAYSLIHPVFHVSQLKPFTPNFAPVYTDLPKLVDLSIQDLQPERVLDHRLVKRRATRLCHKFLSSGVMCPKLLLLGKICTSSRRVFLMLLLGDKQLLRPGEV